MKWNLSHPESRIKVYPEKEGQSIEEKMRKALANNEPIDSVAPMIYTKRSDGALPQYDHRTDRFEIAMQATSHVNATRTAQIKAAREAAAEAAKAQQQGQQQQIATD